MLRKKSKKWFIKVRGSYLPVTWQAWLLYVPFVSFLILVVISAVNDNNQVDDMFYAIFPQWVAAAIVMTWVASQKS